MRIETATGSEREERTKAMLEGLLAEHDTSRWQFTDLVVIDETAVGHSHPVLTLGTKFPVRTRIGVLSTFLHEQIHWYLLVQREACSAAIADLRVMYPHVPGPPDGGARDERSTYLHLVVNWLELESLRSIVGRDCADETLRAACRAPVVYHWIYGRVFEDHEAIGQVVRGRGLAEVLNAAEP